MGIAPSIPRQVAYKVETSLAADIADWNAETSLFVIDPDISGVAQAVVDNENIRPRPGAVHQKIHGLKNTTAAFSMYMQGVVSGAVEDAQAQATALSDFLQAAVGGQRRGYAKGITSGDANTFDVDDPANLAIGDWIFAIDSSAAANAGEGQFYRIIDISVNTVTPDRPLHFDPDELGADTIRAVISCFVHQASATRHDHASHKTLAFLVQGDDDDDVWEIRGCKPALSIDAIAAGTPAKAAFELSVTTFAHESLSPGAWTPPGGSAPPVPGTADDTVIMIADVGSPLADVVTRGSVTPSVSLTWATDAGPNGHEGVHGYIAEGWGEGGVELMVPIDATHADNFTNKVEQHLLIQVGKRDDAWGLYWPQLEYTAKPTRQDEGGLASTKLSFRGRENQTAIPGGMTDADEIEHWRSPLHILLVS